MVNHQWNFSDLQVFCLAARKSSFLAAATELGVSPAYVTKRIAHLESALGVSLFHRSTRRVAISAAGERAYAWAQRVLECADEWHNEAASALRGPLRISTSMRLGRKHLTPILAMLNEQHPGLNLWLELVDRRVDLVNDGFDIDIRMGEVQEPHLIAHHVKSNVRILCASAGYIETHGAPKTLDELARHECLLYRERHQRFGVWHMVGPHGPASVKVTGAMGSNHSDVVDQLALAGKGIVLLASWDVDARIKSGQLVRILPQFHQPADVWAVTACRSSESMKLQTCLRFLIDQLKDGPYALHTISS
jgi:LysR family transcriptional activator of dmlA